MFVLIGLFFGLFLGLSGSLFAQCTHYPTGRELGADDGAGTMGPLDGTMTVDCLRYLSSYQKDGRRIAILVDDRGEFYRVAVGTSIGRPSGEITAITADAIAYYHYYTSEDGAWHEVVRELRREDEVSNESGR